MRKYQRKTNRSFVKAKKNLTGSLQGRELGLDEEEIRQQDGKMDKVHEVEQVRG